MSDNVNVNVNVQVPEGFESLAARMLPWWGQLTALQRQMVLEDMAGAYHSDNLSPEEYCADPMPMENHLATVLEQRAELGLPIPAELLGCTWNALEAKGKVQGTTATANVQEQAALAAEQAAEQEAKAREQAAATLKQVVRAFRHGEKAYRAGLLAAGKLADQYLHQRMAVGDKRSVALQALEGELAKYSSTTVQ